MYRRSFFIWSTVILDQRVGRPRDDIKRKFQKHDLHANGLRGLESQLSNNITTFFSCRTSVQHKLSRAKCYLAQHSGLMVSSQIFKTGRDAPHDNSSADMPTFTRPTLLSLQKNHPLERFVFPTRFYQWQDTLSHDIKAASN